jgi:pilus biogenesis lipoprotein CpaD
MKAMQSAPRLLRRSAGVAALALLAGCADTDPGLIGYAEWKQMDPPPRLLVQDAPVVHAINFAPGATRLSETETGAIAGFLAAEEIGPGERVTVEAPSAGTADTDRIVQRLGAVRSLLEGQGIAVTMAPPAAPGTLGPDQLRLITTRATAVNPDCPGYNVPVSEFDRFGRPNLNMGCSNEINLGLMIADPNDLVRGRPLGPADAERSALAVQKYRTGSEGESEGEGGTSTLSIVPMAAGSGSTGGTQ